MKQYTFLILFVFLASCQKKSYPPQLTAVTPSSAAIGGDIALAGSQFGDAPTVSMGSQAVPTKTHTDNTITLTVPRMNLGATTIRVQNQDGASDPLPFTVQQPIPQLTSIEPGNGIPGTLIKLIGNFLDQSTAVRFGTTQAEISGSATDKELIIKVPQLSRGPVKLIVETLGGQSRADFIVAATPEITNLSSTTLQVGRELIISGRNLLDGVVSLNGKTIDKAQTQVQDSQIKLTILETAVGTGKVSVTVFDKLVATSQQTLTVVLPPPTITSISPVKGVAGTEVTILGENLQNVQEIKFGSLTASIKAAEKGKLVVICPEFGSIQDVQVSVQATSVTSNTKSFTGAPQAEIDQTPIPNGLISGGPLTLKGKNFFAVSSVQFLNGNGDVLALVSSENFLPSDPGSILMKVPVGASSGKVRIVNDYGNGKSRDINSLNGADALTTGNVATSVGTLTNTVISDADCRPAAFFYCASNSPIVLGFSRKSDKESCNQFRSYLTKEIVGGKLFEVLHATYFYSAARDVWATLTLKLERNSQDDAYTGPVIVGLTNNNNTTFFVGNLTKSLDIYAYSLTNGTLFKMCRQTSPPSPGRPEDYWTISCNCK